MNNTSNNNYGDVLCKLQIYMLTDSKINECITTSCSTTSCNKIIKNNNNNKNSENKEAVFSDLAEYLTKLRAKFGEAQVGFPALQESYLPERSWQAVWPPQEVTFQILMENEKHYSTSHRPLFLFIPPKICYPLASWKLISTENLMTEWWTEKGGRRYFIALPPQGNRLWVYWDLEEKVWYAHGTFD